MQTVTMKIPAHIINANQVAVSLLSEGRESESINLIKTTLSTLRALVLAESEGEVRTDSDEEVLLSVMIPLKNSSPSAIHGGVFRVFNRAITMEVPGTDHGHVPVDQYKMGAILLYNAGLCCHLKGMQSGLSQDLVSARDFYRHAFSLISERNAIFGISDLDALLVFSLANNMGHLNSSLFDRGAAWVCWDMMKRLFPAIEESHINAEDALFFFLTIFLVPFDHLRASPAA
jgi:hypothetical protein